MSSLERKKCINCHTEGVSILERKETYHHDQGIFYKIFHITYVCKKGCWHDWTEYYRTELKDFNDDDTEQMVFPEEEIITPDRVKFTKD